MLDRSRWNEKYRAEFQHGRVNPRLMEFAHLLKRGRVLDLAGGLGQNGARLAAQSTAFRVINADVSDEGLMRASKATAHVLVDVGALPFMQNSFDTILNIRFFDSRVIFSEWLTQGGTVFFETFTIADERYRPDFNPAHRFDRARIPEIFRDLEILYEREMDDGKRVYVTIIAQRQGTLAAAPPRAMERNAS